MIDKPRDYAYAGQIKEAIRLEGQAKALEKIIEKELEILHLKPNMKALDAGCGTGFITRIMALKVFPGKVHGIDIDPIFIDTAKKLALMKGIENTQFELGNIDNLKYENGTFDLSYCRLVLMHVKNPVKTILELKRVTKKRGTIAASDNDDGVLISFPNTPKLLLLWSKFNAWAKNRGEDRYIGRKLFSIFSEAGMNSIRIYPIPIFATQQNPDALKMLVTVPIKLIQQDKNAMIKKGIITAKDYEEAMREVELALTHPGAFAMGLNILATGKVR